MIGQSRMWGLIDQGNLLPLWQDDPKPGAESENILLMFELMKRSMDTLMMGDGYASPHCDGTELLLQRRIQNRKSQSDFWL